MKQIIMSYIKFNEIDLGACEMSLYDSLEYLWYLGQKWYHKAYSAHRLGFYGSPLHFSGGTFHEFWFYFDFPMHTDNVSKWTACLDDLFLDVRGDHRGMEK